MDAGSGLQKALGSGRFVVTAEIPAPLGATLQTFRRTARELRGWLDAGNVTDGQGGTVHAASWAGSMALVQEGLEPVMQVQCRDRNRIALQADLLGAAAMGIPNLLLLTGDPPRTGDHPDAKPVFDLTSLSLIETAHRMREEATLLSGRKLPSAPRWFIGAADDPFAAPPEEAAGRLEQKVACGAQFVQTQFVFDVEAFRRWMTAVRDRGLDQRCPIIAGVGPIRSLRALRFLRDQLPGVKIPNEISRRLEGLADDRLAEEGVSICVEIIQGLRETTGVAGVHVMAAGLEKFLPGLLTRAGLR